MISEISYETCSECYLQNNSHCTPKVFMFSHSEMSRFSYMFPLFICMIVQFLKIYLAIFFCISAIDMFQNDQDRIFWTDKNFSLGGVKL